MTSSLPPAETDSQFERLTEEPATDVTGTALGAQQIRGVGCFLIFPEAATIKMIYATRVNFQVREPTRFLERKSFWTGSGVASAPDIRARTGQEPLHASIQGQPWDEDRARYYLVNLGAALPKRAEVSLRTRQQFIDERQRFKPYLSHLVSHEYETLELVAVFVQPPVRCVYRYRPPSVTGWQHEEALALTTRKRYGQSWSYFRLRLDNPAVGYHKLDWN